jgi:hypothetical protein
MLTRVDQETRSIFAGRAAGWGDAQDHRLLARGAAGASDLGQAIAWLGGRTPHARVAVVTDGMITAGAAPVEVAAQIAQLAAVERVDVVLTGGIRDDAAAAVLARAGKRPGRGPTVCRSTTTRRARWATAWACSRSCGTTATAASRSRIGPT